MYNLTDEQIEKAVNWWAERIACPKFDGLSQEERKDPANRSYQMAEVMASMLVEPIDNSVSDKFKAELRKQLENDYNPYHGLHVDYGPDLILGNAAQAAGVSAHNFPWKTSMYFGEDGTVKVRSGYSAPMETI
jgi:hypothetical protein